MARAHSSDQNPRTAQDGIPAESHPGATEDEIQSLLMVEQARLEREVGLEPHAHFQRPVQRPLKVEEHGTTTILFGGLNWRHDKLARSVFRRNGYRCENLPIPDVHTYQAGKKYCNAGQCNPVYFTAGSIIQYLRKLEKQGLSRREIIDNYVYFTAHSCGPCRFGMYEADYRYALERAGFGGFRITHFELNQGANQEGGSGLQYSLDFGMGILKMLNLGDALRDLSCQIRPYEVRAGETDRVFGECMDLLCDHLGNGERFEILQELPRFLSNRLGERDRLTRVLNSLGKIYVHLYGKAFRAVLSECRERINRIEVDRLRVKPIVKVTGEFFAQMTEGDGNYNMYAFLEKEGAHVRDDSIGSMLMHLLNQAKAERAVRIDLEGPYERPNPWELHKRLANRFSLLRRRLPLWLSERLYAAQHHRVAQAMGGSLAQPLVSQAEIARLAHPHYHSLAKGGEAHLEVGKNIYYTLKNHCHMVLSVKPFGCMPSTQSDGIQSTVAERYKHVIFLPIETSGDGEILAHSRVQMALGEAKVKAKAEFEKVLSSTGKSLDDIRDFTGRHPELRQPLYPVPRGPGTTGVAARFVQHVSDLMDGKAAFSRF